MTDHLLSLMTFFPILGMLLLLFIPRDNHGLLKIFTLVVTVITFLISLPLAFDDVFKTSAAFHYTEFARWISVGDFFQMNYNVGVDGISLWLVLLTTFIMPITVLSTWKAVDKNVKGFMALMLLLETAMLGAFISLDLFLFYIFWELMLIPMYFMIGIWGGSRRIYAAVKFFIFTAVGSLLMLVAIIYVYFFSMQAGIDFDSGFSILHFYLLDIPLDLQIWLFLAFAFSFAIKVPMFPVHTWLPDAHTEAPTAGSVILAAILLKMGTYGYLRFAMPLFPDATLKFIPFLSVLAVIGIIYGALVAMMQDDVKKLVAYSSVSHLGFVMLGLFALNIQGLSGGMIQMINHGISTGALFLIVGFIYERRHTRLIADFGGLAKQMPIFATIFMIVTFSSIGLPGTNGFVGEFLILLGAFESDLRWFAVIATTGVIFAAVYMLWMFQRVMFGEIKNPANEKIKDLNAREIALMMPLLLFVFWIGLYPNTFFEKMNPALENMIDQIKNNQVAQVEIVQTAAHTDALLK
ncbi:NADH dehydrogenase subunit M [Geoalkalibacter ferrihydriticus]|uniref:NADH dehydrogenase n=2 Tax=Geoalkalibacter ferrihydriticus TaxID=392333 RepID=A0A0C2HS08_9BACT|nr:NADH-quinone oxidoreductase subunit M [Geoalkalibacter ferrihydriticus]KIH77605.1 NADH dehydrogenase [Geoalkalibacter ferrihydriticus DSM 17813]SDL69965.1 NADH dehydrogenase subunit M [Geoalkalibacter ferrihydriticus]